MPNSRLAHRRAAILAVAAALVAGSAGAALPTPAAAASPNVVISQVYGGGGNSGATYTNDFVELFNRGTTTVSIDGWSVQYASATGTGNFGSGTTQITPLAGSIGPGQYLLVQEAPGSGGTTALPTPDVTDASPIGMSGSAGKVALANTDASLGCNGSNNPCDASQLAQIVDLVGWGSANFFEGSAAAPGTSNTTAVLRASGGCTDTDDNGADFAADAPTPRNSASPLHSCTGPTEPSGVGAATPSSLFAGDATLLTVDVTPGANPTSTGLAVTCDLTAIGGSATQSLVDDGTSGDDVAGDLTFSFQTSIADGTAGGELSLPCTLADAQSRTGGATIAITVLEIVPIGTVNGPVLDADIGTAHLSPYAGQTVTVQGVIYENTLQAISNTSNTYKGFYLQNTAATADGDPTTSDGLFAFMGTFGDIFDSNGGFYVPQVGDEVVVSGRVTEYFNMTELSSLRLVRVVRSGVDIDAEIPPAVADPPVALDDANRYWERLQGSRVQVPAGSIALGGRNVFNPADAEIWVARSDSTIAQRSNPFWRRAFRDAHPLDDNYDPTSWDGNGYRILLGSLGIKASEHDGQALIDPARTFDTLTNAPSGGLNYTFGKYRVEITGQPVFSEGVDPSADNPPQAFDRSLRYSIADYNLENLYDYRDDPFSGCDFTGDSGCPRVAPFLAAVSSPFDYVPASDAAYQARLGDIAHQVITDLHSPDILMVQEVENQDICTVAAAALACGTTDNADGKPDVLQELALRIGAMGGPAYDAAFDRDSSDLRGIAPAFLYRTDRVELLPPAGDPVLGGEPAIGGYTPVPYDADVSNPKTLNAELPAGVSACETAWVFPRAPGVALFRIHGTGIDADLQQDVYVVNNHFKSGPDSCVDHRTEQANYNAALVAFLEHANPDARVVVGGDLNVYPRPDDPFAPIGQPDSSDQLGALYDPSLGLKNLWEVLLGQAPASAYSYVYQGMAQTLDQMFVTPSMLANLDQFRIAHINSDFPADYAGDVARGTSDHDPGVATFVVPFPFSGFGPPVEPAPAFNAAKAGRTVPVKFSLGGDRGSDIFASGPTATPISCTDGTPTGPAVAATGSLRYDPVADQYVYTWRTDRSWAGTCQQLSFTLVDATSHEALFDFRK